MTPIRQMLSESGLTEQQWRVLRVLDEHGALEPSQLAKHAALLLPSQTRIVQSMAQKVWWNDVNIEMIAGAQ